MKKLYALAMYLLGCGICGGQNLVPNGDFEQYSGCPIGIGQVDSSLFWTNPAIPPPIQNGGSPDYFNSCTSNTFIDVPNNYYGQQLAHSGQAYVGLCLKYPPIPNFREYVEVQLTSPLAANVCYYLEMYLNKTDNSRYSTDALSIYFSDTLITGITNWNPLPFTPQINNTSGNYISDTINWVLFTANYTAVGGENYLLIGNFKSDLNTSTVLTNLLPGNQDNSYIYVDDVSLTPCTGAVPVTIIASSDTSICEKQCLDFFDLSTNNPTSWQWFFPGSDTLASTIQNPTNICYNNYGSFDVTLIACNSVGCDTLVLTNFINSYALPLPVITTSFDTLFSSPAVIYQWWNVSSGIIIGANSIYFIPTQTGDYFVIVTDSTGCSGISDTVSITAFIPSINLMSSDTSFCEKQCLSFFDLSTNNPTSWQWFFQGSDSLTSTLQNPTNICYNNYGSFDVTLIACNAAGCDTLVLTNFINEYQSPVDSIFQSNDTLYSLPAFSYQWYEVINGLIAGATNQFYIPAQAGNYYCSISDSIGCIAASNTIVITGLGEIYQSEILILNPNPFSLNLTVSLIKNKPVEINLYDFTGRKVFNQIVSHSATLNTTQLAKGIYIYEVRDKGGVIEKGKLVKK